MLNARALKRLHTWSISFCDVYWICCWACFEMLLFAIRVVVIVVDLWSDCVSALARGWICRQLTWCDCVYNFTFHVAHSVNKSPQTRYLVQTPFILCTFTFMNQLNGAALIWIDLKPLFGMCECMSVLCLVFVSLLLPSIVSLWLLLPFFSNSN